MLPVPHKFAALLAITGEQVLRMRPGWDIGHIEYVYLCIAAIRILPIVARNRLARFAAIGANKSFAHVIIISDR